MKLVVIDYGAGNLRSVERALHHVGAAPVISSSPDDVVTADVLILPGVGAAGDTMRALIARELIEPVREYVTSGRPFLGVCLGLQVLLTESEEDGGQPCLDLVPGIVRRLPGELLKVPHMGWNQVNQKRGHPIFEGIPNNANFYFVHSYYADPGDPAVIAGETEYGIEFTSVLARENVVATQFHPEKSGEVGLQIYRNFLSWAGL